MASSSLALAAVWCPEYSDSYCPDSSLDSDSDSSSSQDPPSSSSDDDDDAMDWTTTTTTTTTDSPSSSLSSSSSSSSSSSPPSSAITLRPPPPPLVSLSPAAIQYALRELFVVASFGSYQVTTLVSGLASLLAPSSSSSPSSSSPPSGSGWQNALMHLALHMLRQNIAFQGVTVPRLRFWSNAAGASSLPHGVTLESRVRFTVHRDHLLAFERVGTSSSTSEYPTVPKETFAEWSLPANATYELHAEWLLPDNPPSAAGGGASCAAGASAPAGGNAAAAGAPSTCAAGTFSSSSSSSSSWFGALWGQKTAPPTLPPLPLRTKVIYYLHGGAYIAGSPQIYRNLTGRISKHTRTRLFALRYRLAPESPFPAALHDAFAGYLYLTNPYHPAFSHLGDPPPAHHEPISPSDIVIMGDSAGGGLALALLNYLNLYLRDAVSGELLVPMPAAAVLLSPWADLTFTSHSWQTNDRLDWLPAIARNIHHEVAPGVPHPVYMYLYGENASKPKSHLAALTRGGGGGCGDNTTTADDATVQDRVEQFVRHPLVSPIFAPTLQGLPPLLIQAGDAEVLRDDSLALAYKYDADNVGRHGSKSWVRHEMYPEMVHVFVAAPWLKATAAALKRIDRFLDEVELGEPMPPLDIADGVLVDSHVGV
ncbi:hypothetical protein HDU86_001832 [Geranomyces michiganensis]|nr:hypothetical protein HDU86_001832 [Geranomyces michiganensis]